MNRKLLVQINNKWIRSFSSSRESFSLSFRVSSIPMKYLFLTEGLCIWGRSLSDVKLNKTIYLFQQKKIPKNDGFFFKFVNLSEFQSGIQFLSICFDNWRAFRNLNFVIINSVPLPKSETVFIQTSKYKMDQYYKLADQPANLQIQSSLPKTQTQNQLPPNGLQNNEVQTPAVMLHYYQHPFLQNRNNIELERRSRIGDQCVPACPRPKNESSCCISWVELNEWLKIIIDQ